MDRPLVGVCLCVWSPAYDIDRNPQNIKMSGIEVLLQKRLSEHAYRQYGFPGGHLELYESFQDCALRELKEEAGSGFWVTLPQFWTTKNVLFKEEGKHYATIFMVSQYLSGLPVNMEPDKNEGWSWYNWDKLPQPLMPGIQQIILDGEHPLKV